MVILVFVFIFGVCVIILIVKKIIKIKEKFFFLNYLLKKKYFYNYTVEPRNNSNISIEPLNLWGPISRFIGIPSLLARLSELH